MPIAGQRGDIKRIRPDRRFRCASHGDELTVRIEGPVACRQRPVYPVARQHNGAQAGRNGVAKAFAPRHQHVEQRGNAVPERHAVPFDQCAPRVWIAALAFIGHHQRTARAQHAKQVVNRQIEVQCRQRQHTVVRADLIATVDVDAGVQRTAVRHHDPLGHPR